jgi:hypothetical protein
MHPNLQETTEKAILDYTQTGRIARMILSTIRWTSDSAGNR